MSIRTRLVLIFGSLALLVVMSAAISSASLYQMNRQGSVIFGDILRATGSSTQFEISSTGSAVAHGKEQFDAAIQSFGIRQAALVSLALIMIVALSLYLQRNVLARLEKLRRFSAALVQGRTTVRLNLPGNDELTALARPLNAALDHQLALRAEMIGRLNQMKALTLALLGSQSRPAALLDLAGDILASTLDDAAETAVSTASDAIKKLAASTEPSHELDLGEGRRARLTLLRKSGKGSAMGWLLTV